MDYLNFESSVSVDLFNGMGLILSVVLGGLSILMIICWWKIFNKLGKKGWASLVPIYNLWVMFECGDLPGWLCLIPVANVIGMFIIYFKIPPKLGKSAAFGLGLLFLPFIFLPILAFSKVGIESGESNNTPSLNSNELNENVNMEMPNLTNDNNASNSNLEEQNIENAPVIFPNINENANEVNNMNQTVEMPNAVNNQNAFPNDVMVNNAFPSENTTPNIDAFSNNIENQNIQTEVLPTIDVDNTQTEVLPAFENINNIPTNENFNVDNGENIQEPLTNEMPNETLETPIAITNEVNEQIDTLDVTAQNNIDKDVLEETVELPKMANVEINNSITEKKVCPICGYENEYSSKNCGMCGNELN